MPFYRNYAPKFNRTNDEYLEYIKGLLNDSQHKIVIVENEAPYNTYDGKEVETHHLTMRYSPNTDKHWLFHKERELMKQGYSVQEVSDELKSIKRPHRHFIKKKTSN